MNMKSIFLLSALWTSAFASCDPETMLPLPDGVSKLTVTGFDSPIINYFSAISGMVSAVMWHDSFECIMSDLSRSLSCLFRSVIHRILSFVREKLLTLVFQTIFFPLVLFSQGDSIIMKGYSMLPQVSASGDELVITAGAPCDGTAPTVSPTTIDASGSLALFGMSSYLLGAPALLTAASILLASAPFSSAEETPSITVDIYIDADKMLHADSGNSECPPETMLWKHHDGVFDGYEGCVSEKYLYPCSQYARPEIDWNVEKLPYSYSDGECVESGYSLENRTFWILWGDPLDVSGFVSFFHCFPIAIRSDH
jgi:hypothetical protein